MKNAYSLKGLTAFITGASSGIGKACAEQLAALGVHLVITARRLERLEDMAQLLSTRYGVKVLALALDVQKKKQVDTVFERLAQENIGVDLLINNAGLALSTDKLQEAKTENWDIMIDTNVKGLLYVTRAVLPQMVERNRGHIINIGSVAGQGYYMAGNVYCATKHAVKALSHCLRLDLLGTKIRVSEIAPGAVETEFSEVRWNDKERAKKFYQDFEPLVADDIADAVIYCASRPEHVNISELVVFPQAQASLTDLYREGQAQKNLFSK
jgi:3-hydroxy acid dehydrogenase/malonic semialdehyde reductase